MLLESLGRLAQIQEWCKKNGVVIEDENFMKDTDVLIEQQTKMVQSELNSRDRHPGPHTFGFGDISLTVYTPENTGDTFWALVADKGDEREVYAANGLATFLEAMIDSFSKFSNVLPSIESSDERNT
jgi:hypothetical protein